MTDAFSITQPLLQSPHSHTQDKNSLSTNSTKVDITKNKKNYCKGVMLSLTFFFLYKNQKIKS